jgi:hypothetical protein
MIKLDCNGPKNARTGCVVTGKRLYLLMKPISLLKGTQKLLYRGAKLNLKNWTSSADSKTTPRKDVFRKFYL